MRKSQRTILFWALAAMFCVATPIIILSSQGYVFDWEQKRLVQTGAIFIKSNPISTVVRIGNHVERINPPTEILYTGTLFQSLLPKSYPVEIAAPDYTTFLWKKTLVVNPLVVTKMSHIAIPYAQPTSRATHLSTSTIAFAKQRDANSLIWSSDMRTLFAYDAQNKTSNAFATLNAVASSSQSDRMQNVLFSKNGDNAFIRTRETVLIAARGKIFDGRTYLAPFMASTTLTLSDITFRWHANQNNMLILMTRQGGYAFDTNTQAYIHFTAKPIRDISENKTGNYFVDASGTVYEYNPVRSRSERIITLLPVEHASQYTWTMQEAADNQLVVHAANGPLSLVDTARRTSQRIANRVAAFAISHDETKILYATPDELSVFFTKEVYDDVKYHAYESFRVAPLAKTTRMLAFMNNSWSAAVFQQDALTIIEIDPRGPNNQWNITTRAIPFPVSCSDNACAWLTANDYVHMPLFP